MHFNCTCTFNPKIINDFLPSTCCSANWSIVCALSGVKAFNFYEVKFFFKIMSIVVYITMIVLTICTHMASVLVSIFCYTRIHNHFWLHIYNGFEHCVFECSYKKNGVLIDWALLLISRTNQQFKCILFNIFMIKLLSLKDIFKGKIKLLISIFI